MADPELDIRRQLQAILDQPSQHFDLSEDIALPREVAPVLDTTLAGLAQLRYRGTGPRFIKRGRRVLYRWSDIRDYLAQNTVLRTDDPRGAGVA